MLPGHIFGLLVRQTMWVATGCIGQAFGFDRQTYTFCSGALPSRMMLPLPKRAFSSLKVPSRTRACMHHANACGSSMLCTLWSTKHAAKAFQALCNGLLSACKWYASTSVIASIDKELLPFPPSPFRDSFPKQAQLCWTRPLAGQLLRIGPSGLYFSSKWPRKP